MPNLITANDVCARLGGVTKMTLWRYLNDEEMAFPKPIYIRTRRYWKEADLAEWIEGCATNA
ncbi:helix-turn-helix transcriptional regulator [Salipiger mangrovisoli]|uniref:Transcriptional regulator n=1 Tax=Salipiger mangrovisoli TaxID=2865933 RepID=A0ABR9WZ09_9RHOB|nr:helix-turn-helix domain-containing protein [Salipiger mangrovisoli]MBE9636540.1 transcriptional regulator [Salipiger mangrovisoli]